MGFKFCVEMYWFLGTGTAQQMSTAKLPVLSKSLKRSMVSMGLGINSLW